jgi:hypothetical protein
VKQRQEFRIRLQKRARRAAERKLESFEEERLIRTVLILFSGCVDQVHTHARNNGIFLLGFQINNLLEGNVTDRDFADSTVSNNWAKISLQPSNYTSNKSVVSDRQRTQNFKLFCHESYFTAVITRQTLVLGIT